MLGFIGRIIGAPFVFTVLLVIVMVMALVALIIGGLSLALAVFNCGVETLTWVLGE